MKLITIVFLLSLMTSFSAWSHIQAHSRVEKMMGRSTFLLPGQMSPRLLQEGEEFISDVSITTAANAFVRLRLPGQGHVVIGPQAHVVISFNRDVYFINILSGPVRVGYRQNSPQSLLFVQSRYALLNVEQGEFLVSYNGKNKQTITLGLDGLVRKVMINDEDFFDTIWRRRYRQENFYHRTRDRRSLLRTDLEHEHFFVEEHQKMRNVALSLLERNEKVELAAGQFAMTVHPFGKVSKPALISPAQFSLLKRNENLEVAEFVIGRPGSQRGDVYHQDLSRFTFEPMITPRTAPQGQLHLRRKEFAPKAGGVIDFFNALYISPPQDAFFDRDKKLYRVETSDEVFIGHIDVPTGFYYPPHYLTLDPLKGFEVAARAHTLRQVQASEVLEQRNRLNDLLGLDFLLPLSDEKSRTVVRALSVRELNSRDYLSINFSLGDQNIEMENSDFVDPDIRNRASLFRWSLDWQHGSEGRYQLLTGIQYQTIKADMQSRAYQSEYDSNSLLAMHIAVLQNISSRWTLGLGFELSQYHYYYTHFEDTQPLLTIKKVTLPLYRFLINGQLLRTHSGRVEVNFHYQLSYHTTKNAGSFDIDAGLGHLGRLSSRFWATSRWWVEAAAEVKNRESVLVDKESGVQIGTQTFNDRALSLGLGLVF